MEEKERGWKKKREGGRERDKGGGGIKGEGKERGWRRKEGG